MCEVEHMLQIIIIKLGLTFLMFTVCHAWCLLLSLHFLDPYKTLRGGHGPPGASRALLPRLPRVERARLCVFWEGLCGVSVSSVDLRPSVCLSGRLPGLTYYK